MSLCPSPDLGCDECVDTFLAEHPGAETWRHTTHHCDCPWVASPPDDARATVCVGCGERRDLAAEFDRVLGKAS
jgi:hypothetical protein